MTTLLNVQRTLLQLYSGREQVQQNIKKKKKKKLHRKLGELRNQVNDYRLPLKRYGELSTGYNAPTLLSKYTKEIFNLQGACPFQIHYPL